MAAKTDKQRRADRAASRRRRRKQSFITCLVILCVLVVLILVLMHTCGKEKEPTEKTAATTAATSQSQTTAAITTTTTPAHEIVEQDGFTYVDGVLVVNKTYSIPAEFDLGDLSPECSDAFYEMQAAAEADGIGLWIASGYRSYETQRDLYESYLAEDPDADAYSARPGHSEHQTGLAIDLNDVSDTFGETPEGQWVAEHCADYGFILRYPKDKEAQTGYMYEPWHIRYVGVEMAQNITASGLCLEEYFGITSEYAE